MVIVSSFREEYNSETGIYKIISSVTHPCPLCGAALSLRDYVERKAKSIYGESRTYLLRRLKCAPCGKTHRELPDIIQPFKHYDSETIQCVLDDSKEAPGCMAHDTTKWRWKRGFEAAEPDISQKLASVYAKMNGGVAPILTVEAILPRIRSDDDRWLPYVTELLINGGHKPCTLFASCPPPPPGKISPGTKFIEEGGKNHVPAITATG